MSDDTDYINFYWIRHAESVANLYNNKPTDKYDKKVSELLKVEVQRFLNNDYNNVQAMFSEKLDVGVVPEEIDGGGKNRNYRKKKQYKGGSGEIKAGDYPLVDKVYQTINKFSSDLENNDNISLADKKKLTEFCTSNRIGDLTSFESRDQAKLDAIYDFKGDPNNGKCIGTAQGLVISNKISKKAASGAIEGYKNFSTETKREIAQMYAQWLKNFIPTNFLFQPTLSNMGVTQASILGEQFATNDKLNTVNPDIVICSAMVRTMMTAYLTILFANHNRKKNGLKELPTTIYIVPYINEKQTDAQFVFPDGLENLYDFANVAIHPDKIHKVAQTIEYWFEHHYKPFFQRIYNDTTPEYSEASIGSFKPPSGGTAPSIYPKIPSTPIRDSHIKFDTSMYTKEARYNNKEIVRQASVEKFKTFIHKEINSDGNLSPLNKTKVNNILVSCHGFIIDEIHKETGINHIKDSIKKLDLQEVFNTWGCNTSVFTHPYYFDRGEKAFKDVIDIEINGKKIKEIKDAEDVEHANKVLKEMYLLYFLQGENLVRKHSSELRPEDITRFGDEEEQEKLTSLLPGSLRGDIALITHGKGSEGQFEEKIGPSHVGQYGGTHKKRRKHSTYKKKRRVHKKTKSNRKNKKSHRKRK
jgi:hypothetical protein